MRHQYTHFIKQNIAPEGAREIGIYANGGRAIAVALGALQSVDRQRSYSFGLVSDIHLRDSDADWNPITKFENALSFFGSKNCSMCVITGDLTQTGFYQRSVETDASTTYPDDGQFAKYREICAKQPLPIYELSGNHESYYGMSVEASLDKWTAYTGKEALYYHFEQVDDLFIMLGQPNGSVPMSDDALQWIYRTLEANRNKRCFIFVHPDISSGNPSGAYSSNRSFDSWGTKTDAFKNLLRHYKNTILFHGHTHTKLEAQTEDPKANYSERDGFRSIHVPSLCRPRSVENGVIGPYIDGESQCYIVDVYESAVVLNGLDLIDKKPVPLGTYRIDTTLQTIEANTFTDSAGIIRAT